MRAALACWVLLGVICGCSADGTRATLSVCQDQDDDGRGVGCASGPDCDDSDPLRFENCPDSGAPDCEAEPLARGCPCVSGDRQACYPAAADSRDVGPCRAGLVICHDEAWSRCEDVVLPSVEICNGSDDDCDGFTDEGVLSPCGGCDPECSGGVWGPPAQPFDVSDPLAVTGAGELTLKWQPYAATTLWVPSTEAGLVSKIDASAARELARYRTRGGYPIRVAVDHRGDAWVLDGTFGGQAYLTKFAARRDDCRDKNGDGVHTSGGPSDVLPAGDDECAVLQLPLSAADDPRSLAVDGALAPDDQARAGNVWLGLAGAAELVQLDGSTGQELARYPLPEFVPLKSAFDPFGALWAIDRAGVVLRFDPLQPEAAQRRLVPYACYELEALSIDAQGRLLLSGFGCENVFSYDPARDVWRKLAAPALLSPRGVLALSSADSWVAYDSGQIASLKREPLQLGEAQSLEDDGLEPFETLALSADGSGQVWAISTQGGPDGAGLATRFDPLRAAVTAQVPLARGPRASGDFSGAANGGDFVSSGATSHVFGGCGRAARESDDESDHVPTRWLRVHVAAIMGVGAHVDLWMRQASSEAELPDSAYAKLGALPSDATAFALSAVNGGVIEIKLALYSPLAIGAPRIARIGVEWTCPGPD